MISIRYKCLIFALFLTGSLSQKSFGSADLHSVNYDFNQQKLDEAKDSFHFLRTYVDYFYLLVNANKSNFQSLSTTTSVPGWCVGDAHAENFGVLIQDNGSSLFSMNDIDDSGPCPIVLDIFRLMVSSRLYDNNIKLNKILEAYLEGVQGTKRDLPLAIQNMIQKSQKKGIAPSNKKISGNKLVRDSEMSEVSSEVVTLIKQALHAYMNSSTDLLDVVATSKAGGGSGGLLRYEVLLSKNGVLLHLELKEEITPSIYPVEIGPAPDTTTRILTMLHLDQGEKLSKYYNVIQVDNKTLLVRPRFAGNIGISLNEQSNSENKEIINYEAYQLGLIHSRSINNISSWVSLLQNVKSKDWEADVESMTTHFEKTFSKLKK